MNTEEFDLRMAITNIKNLKTKMEPYMNETDISNFDSLAKEPYTQGKLDTLRELVKIIEEESGINFTRMMWRN